MKKTLTSFLLFGLTVAGHAQQQQFRQEQIMGKNWIVLEMDDLKKGTVEDYLKGNKYCRFSIDSFVFQACYEPYFGSRNLNWNLSKGNRLQLAMAMYQIEELTDSSMVIVQPNVIRIKLLSEAYLGCREEQPQAIDTFNGKPLYKASKYVCPHYETSFFQLLEGRFSDEKTGKYSISFIITEKGAVGNIVISPATSRKFEKKLLQAFNNTDHHWTPAMFCGEPVQTVVTYTVVNKGLINSGFIW